MLLLVLGINVFIALAAQDLPVLDEILNSGYSQIDKELQFPGTTLVAKNCGKCWEHQEDSSGQRQFNLLISMAVSGLKYSSAWGTVITSIGQLFLQPNDPYLDKIRNLDRKITSLINSNTVSENHKMLGQHENKMQQLASKPSYVKELPFRAGSSDNWMCTPTRQNQVRQMMDEVLAYMSTYQLILTSTKKLDKVTHNVARGSIFLKILDSIPFLAELATNVALATLETEPAMHNEGVGEYCLSQMHKFRILKTSVEKLYEQVKPLAFDWISSDCSNFVESNRFPRAYPGAEFLASDNPWSNMRWENSQCATQQFGWFAQHHATLNRLTCGCNNKGCNLRLSRALQPAGKYSLIHQMHRECKVLHNNFIQKFQAKYFAESPAAKKVKLMQTAYSRLQGSSEQPRVCLVRKRVAPDGRTTPIGYYMEAVQHQSCLNSVESLTACTFAVRQAHEEAYNQGNGKDYCGKPSYHTSNNGSTGSKSCSGTDTHAKCSLWKEIGRCGDSKPQRRCPQTCCGAPLNLGFQTTDSSDDGEVALSGAGPAASSSVLLSVALLLASVARLVPF